MIRAALTTFVLASALGSVAACRRVVSVDCSVTTCAAAPSCDGCACGVADPVGRCVRVAGCADDRDCPAGTVCDAAASVARPAAPFSSCAVDGAGACILAPVASPFDASLVFGMNTQELALTATAGSDGSTSYQLVVPAEAVIVECALFVCAPVFRDGIIVSQDECVVDRRELGPGDPYTPSAFARVNRVAPPCSAPLTLLGPSPRSDPTITELAVGCWALDDAHLLGASALTAISRADAPSFTRLVQDCGAPEAPNAAAEGASCVLAARSTETEPARYGSCVGGVCSERCVTAADCPPEIEHGCRPFQPSCSHRDPLAFVGTCDPSPCRRTGAP